MIYAYYRKLSEGDTEKVILQINQWAEKHYLHIDEFVWEDFVAKNTSFDKRNLAIHILPKLNDGDILIVSQLSCLGRSAAEIDSFFNLILTTQRLVRIVCIPIGLDIDFSKISPTNKSILEKISYAAKLQRFLAHEVTESALSAKRNKGVKMGAASEKYKERISNKSKEEIDASNIKKGETKTKRYLERKDTIIFVNILRIVFKEACKGEPHNWSWNLINTKIDNRIKVLSLMKKYKDDDFTLFKDWDFSDDILSARLHTKLANAINTVCRSYKRSYKVLQFYKLNERNVKDNSKSGMSTRQNTNVTLDKLKLKDIEKDTEKSQNVLSYIFSNQDTNEEYEVSNSSNSAIREIMTTLLSKNVWSHIEVEALCKHHGLLIGSVLEQINEYSYSKVDDSVINEDDDKIYVVTEYKQYLI